MEVKVVKKCTRFSAMEDDRVVAVKVSSTISVKRKPSKGLLEDETKDLLLRKDEEMYNDERSFWQFAQKEGFDTDKRLSFGDATPGRDLRPRACLNDEERDGERTPGAPMFKTPKSSKKGRYFKNFSPEDDTDDEDNHKTPGKYLEECSFEDYFRTPKANKKFNRRKENNLTVLIKDNNNINVTIKDQDLHINKDNNIIQKKDEPLSSDEEKKQQEKITNNNNNNNTDDNKNKKQVLGDNKNHNKRRMGTKAGLCCGSDNDVIPQQQEIIIDNNKPISSAGDNVTDP